MTAGFRKLDGRFRSDPRAAPDETRFAVFVRRGDRWQVHDERLTRPQAVAVVCRLLTQHGVHCDDVRVAYIPRPTR